MNVRISLAIFLVAALSACGAGRAELDTRTFELKYLREGDAAALISPYVYADRPNGKGMFTVASTTITVRETRDNLDKIGRVLAEYDRPRPTVRLTFRLIEADGTASGDTAIADVEPVLRKLFRFHGYRLAAEGVVSGVEGTSVSQILSVGPGRFEVGAAIDHLSGRGDSATVELGVQLKNVFLGGAFVTTLGMPLGKTAVLGNVQGGTAKTTLILTVRPELLTASPTLGPGQK